MKNNKPLIITLICLISVFILALIAFIIFAINGKFKFSNFNFMDEVSTNLLLEEEYDNKFNEIIVNVDSADVEIKKVAMTE